MLKYCDIHIRFGTASPCVGFVTYALVCDHICRTLQTVDVELECTVGHSKDMLKTCDKPKGGVHYASTLEQTKEHIL